MKTYHGSCHCGAVTFDADLDLSKGTVRCTCSYCRKTRNWIVMTLPDNVTVTAGADVISRFTGQMGGTYEFCSKCGIRLWTRGDAPGYGPFCNIFVPTLDAEPEELIAAPLTWIDMANDDWQKAPDEVRHL